MSAAEIAALEAQLEEKKQIIAMEKRLAELRSSTGAAKPKSPSKVPKKGKMKRDTRSGSEEAKSNSNNAMLRISLVVLLVGLSIATFAPDALANVASMSGDYMAGDDSATTPSRRASLAGRKSGRTNKKGSSKSKIQPRTDEEAEEELNELNEKVNEAMKEDDSEKYVKYVFTTVLKLYSFRYENQCITGYSGLAKSPLQHLLMPPCVACC
jgi:hypothetical protein